MPPKGSQEPAFAQPPTGETYVRMTASSLWDNSPLLLLGGLVFILLCLPAIVLFMLGLLVPATVVSVLTVAPTWAALSALEAQIAREVRTTILAMLRALPKFWLRSVGLGVLALFPVLVGIFTLAMDPEPALYLYAFPLLVLYDAPLGTALSNGLILASHHLRNTLGLLGMGALFGIGIVRLNLGLILVLPAIWGMFIVNNCRMVMAEEVEEAN